MENKNKTKTVIVIVLVAIVLILVGYFVYDKFISDSKKTGTENEKSEEKVKLTTFYFGMCKDEKGVVNTCKSEIKSDITNYYFHYSCKTANCSASADSEIIYIVDNDELHAYYLEPKQVADKVQELPINYALVSKEKQTNNGIECYKYIFKSNSESKEELTFIQYEKNLLLTGIN